MSAPQSRPHVESFWACCSPCGLCWKSCCCPCLVFGQNHHRIKTGSLNGYKSCSGACCGWTALQYCFGFGWLLQCLDRETLRQQQNLEGSSMTSCLGSCCCVCCELMQTKKELDYIAVSQHPSGEAAPAYHQQPGMVAQPQYHAQSLYQNQTQPGYGHPANGLSYTTSNGAHSQTPMTQQQTGSTMPRYEKTPIGHNF